MAIQRQPELSGGEPVKKERKKRVLAKPASKRVNNEVQISPLVSIETTSGGKVGRPTIMTDIVIGKLEEAFAIGCSDIEACFYAGIHKATLYDYQQTHPEFVDRKEALKSNPAFIAKKSLITAMKSSGELALKYLERTNRKDFSLRTEASLDERIEHSGSIDVTGADDDALTVRLERIISRRTA